MTLRHPLGAVPVLDFGDVPGPSPQPIVQKFLDAHWNDKQDERGRMLPGVVLPEDLLMVC